MLLFHLTQKTFPLYKFNIYAIRFKLFYLLVRYRQAHSHFPANLQQAIVMHNKPCAFITYACVHSRSPTNSPNKKSAICIKQRILYIQFSPLVKMVFGSKAITFNSTHNTPPQPPFPHYPLPRTNTLAI